MSLIEENVRKLINSCSYNINLFQSDSYNVILFNQAWLTFVSDDGQIEEIALYAILISKIVEDGILTC